MFRILVIDDDLFVRRSIEKTLVRKGYSVVTAGSGPEGVQLAITQLPDLIICDVNLGDGSGYSALESLRATAVTAAIPFVLMTGNPSHEGMRLGMNYGADDYLHKPFGIDTLLLAVESRLRKQRILQDEAKKTEARLVAILEATPDLVCIADKDQSCLYLNRAGRRLLGLSPSHPPAGLRLSDLLQHDYLDHVLDAASSTGAWSGETVLRNNANHVIPVSQLLLAHKASDGSVEFFSTIARDITRQKQAESVIRESEARFRALLSAISDYAICMLDANGIIVTWNAGAERLEGICAADALGRHFSIVYTADEIAAGVPQEHLARAVSTGRFEREGWRSRKDGSQYWSVFAITSFRDDAGNLGGFAMVTSDRTESMRIQLALRNANERLQTVSTNLLHVQESERRHLARELHDEIGQTLTATKINLASLQQTLDSPVAVQRLEDSIAVVDHLLSQVRQLSLNLRPPMLDDLGLVPALRWYLDQLGQRSRLQTQLVARSDFPRLPLTIETACFRTAQEALTNVLRHSHAKNVVVKIEQTPTLLLLKVQDDGVGFEPAAARTRAEQGSSLGLIGMEERVLLVGGTFECHSRPGNGTQIHCSFPLSAKTPHKSTNKNS